MKIRLGRQSDVDALERLYDDLNGYLAAGINYPGWSKGAYPIRQDAIDGINEKRLFVAEIAEELAGTMILRNKFEEAYYCASWQKKLDESEAPVIYTFAVSPKYFRQGVGEYMLSFALQWAADTGAKALRLDVYEKNTPAIKLYEKLGFKHTDTVSLGLEQYGLDYFRLYEKLL